MRFRGFIGGSGVTQSLIEDAEDTINFYVEQNQMPGADLPSALFPTPGFSRWASVSDVSSRGAIYAKSRLFWILGAGLYEFDSNGTATKRGTVALDGNPAQFIYNGLLGNQLGIAAGGNAYAYDLSTNVLTQVLTGECTMIAYAAGYGLAFNITTGKVRLSTLLDLSTWPAGTFFQRSLFSDPYQAMFVDTNNLVWLIGTDSFEVRYNSGTGTQPFVPLSGLVGRFGIASPFAYGLSGAGNVWLARNPEGIGQFVATSGSLPRAISTYAVNTAIAGYLRSSRIDDAECVTYQQEGHTFASLSFPSAPATWAVDLETPTWCRRGQFNVNLGRFDVWAPRVHCFAFGKHLIGDRTTGQISQMDTTIATEVNGSGIVRERTAPAVLQEHRRVPIDQLELLMDTGLGTVTGQGSDPQALMRLSVDGGRTFGNELRCGVGRIGEYRRRVFWTRLGAPAHAVFKVRFSDPAPYRVIDAWLNNAEKAA